MKEFLRWVFANEIREFIFIAIIISSYMLGAAWLLNKLDRYSQAHCDHKWITRCRLCNKYKMKETL